MPDTQNILSDLEGNVVPQEDLSDFEESDFDVEMALFALSTQQDIGEPTEDLHLDQLSNAEKRILLAYMRQRLGGTPQGEEASA